MHAWIDVSAGVAGDMLLGAILDAGAPLDEVQRVLDQVVPGSVRLHAEPVVRGGQRGTKAQVEVLVDDPPHRTWATIRTMLQEAAIPAWTADRALDAFGALALAEARVHGTSPDEVHFHEVGALDSLADVVGTCEGLRLLGVESLSASPVALGEGRIRAAHGDIPVPVPAVVELALGWQVLQTRYSGVLAPAPGTSAPHQHAGHSHGHDEPAEVTLPGAVGELATPTGMALVRALAASCEPMPSMTMVGVGIGCGGKDFADHPNVVRMVLGDRGQDAPVARTEDPLGIEVHELEATVDDMDPRLWPGVIDALLAAGARDAWLVPCVMKKGRPGFVLHALAAAPEQERVGDVMLRQTSTLGIRSHRVRRTMLQRYWRTLTVRGVEVEVKVGHDDGIVAHATAEFDSLARAARELGIGEQEMLAAVQAAIVEAGLVPGARVTD